MISTEQELVSTSATSTPSGSRAVSPIPSKHPSRTAIRAGNSGKPVGGLLVKGDGRQRGTSPVGFGGIWEGGWTSSWTALQGLASSVLGVEVEGENGDSSNDGLLRKKHKKKPSTKLPDSWGPAGLPQKKDPAIGTGTLAEREAAVRVRKMRGVLEGRDDDLNVQKDLNGYYKRRTSLEESRQDEQDDGGEALVYVHHVRPQDTLTGVILRYNCQPAVFRKANRFWPNDSIQTRKVVFIPVDACTIKGRPCDSPSPDSPNQGVDLLAPTPGIEDPPPLTNGGTWPRVSSSKIGTSAERSESDEHERVHVRWVLIDSSPSSKPVEIARMPRKALGYFPPRRRKSQATLSSVSTPRASFDIPRSHPNDLTNSPSSTTSRRTSNLGPRPSQPIGGSYFPPAMPSSTRPRRESVSETADRLGWMRGPGGVGTMGKDVRKPGPAQDGLNSWAKKHIPGLAIDSLPSTSILGGESAHFGFDGELGSIAEGGYTAGAQGIGTVTLSGGSGNGLGLENAAAAIEGWVRRLAIKTPGTPKLGGSRHAEATDLIELLDGAGSDDGRGFELNPGSLRAPISSIGGSGRDDLDGLARGRTTAGAKGGKSD